MSKPSTVFSGPVNMTPLKKFNSTYLSKTTKQDRHVNSQADNQVNKHLLLTLDRSTFDNPVVNKAKMFQLSSCMLPLPICMLPSSQPKVGRRQVINLQLVKSNSKKVTLQNIFFVASIFYSEMKKFVFRENINFMLFSFPLLSG